MKIKKSSNTEEKLIKSTIELLYAKGPRGTSIRDIASAMGMSISNIYHYFGNKEGLLVAVLKYSYEPILTEMKKISESEVDPLERFKSLIRTHILIVKERKKEAMIAHRFMNEVYLSNEAANVNRELQHKVLEIYLKEIRSLKCLGYFPDRSPTILAFNTIGIINWFGKWYKPEGHLSVEEIIKQILSFVLDGIQVRQIVSK